MFFIAHYLQQPKGGSNLAIRVSLTDECIHKIWYIHTVDYYSIKKEENSDTCYKWMNLEDIILNEISHTQKDRYYMMPLT